MRNQNQTLSAAEARLSSQAEEIGKSIIDKLFGTLKLQYPTFLNGQPEIETKRIWFAHLQSYRIEHIEAAALLAPERFPRFAPTIGEFKKLLAEINTPKPGTAIEMSNFCSQCRADRRSQRHVDVCLK